MVSVYGCVCVPPVFGDAGAVVFGAAGLIGAGAGSLAAGAVVDEVVVASVVAGALICIHMKPPISSTAMMAIHGMKPGDLRAASGVVRSSGRSGRRFGSRGRFGSIDMLVSPLLCRENKQSGILFQKHEKSLIF